MSQLNIEGLYPTKLWFDPRTHKMAGGYRVSTFPDYLSDEGATPSFEDAVDYHIEFTADYVDDTDGKYEYLLELDFEDFKIKKFIGITSESTTDHELDEEAIEQIKKRIFERVAHAFQYDKNNRLPAI